MTASTSTPGRPTVIEAGGRQPLKRELQAGDGARDQSVGDSGSAPPSTVYFAFWPARMTSSLSVEDVGVKALAVPVVEVRRAEDIGRVFGRGDRRVRAGRRIVDRRDVDRERVADGVEIGAAVAPCRRCRAPGR